MDLSQGCRSAKKVEGGPDRGQIESFSLSSFRFPSGLEVCPIKSSCGSGERGKLPQQGLERNPSQNRIWWTFILKIWHPSATILIYTPPPPKYRDMSPVHPRSYAMTGLRIVQSASQWRSQELVTEGTKGNCSFLFRAPIFYVQPGPK